MSITAQALEETAPVQPAQLILIPSLSLIAATWFEQEVWNSRFRDMLRVPFSLVSRVAYLYSATKITRLTFLSSRSKVKGPLGQAGWRAVRSA